MLVRGLHRTQQRLHFLPTLQRASSTAEALRERVNIPKVGVPLEEGPSTSIPDGDKRIISEKVSVLVEKIVSLPLIEIADLNYALKKRLNLSDMPMVPQAGMFMSMAAASASQQSIPGSSEQPEEEQSAAPTKTFFAVKLTKFDASKKIHLIKEVKATLPDINLVQAKKLIESAPVQLVGDMGMKEAEDLKAKLEQHGAICEIV